jgi:DtxR family Mn-dependent transcriptional regulator
MLSQSSEDYLKTIYHLSLSGSASTNDIAKAMQVAPASVTNMLKRLAEMKLVAYTSHRGVTLTDGGRKVALEILRHHRLLELYLAEILGYPLDKVHQEAEHLEHHISEDFEEKIAELLGHPEYDPHGDPIPSKDGVLPATSPYSLNDMPIGTMVVIRRIAAQDGDLLRYLMQLELVPKKQAIILEKTPFDGALTIQIGENKHVIGVKVAAQVFVEPIGRWALHSA